MKCFSDMTCCCAEDVHFKRSMCTRKPSFMFDTSVSRKVLFVRIILFRIKKNSFSLCFDEGCIRHYLDEAVFPVLLPALDAMMTEALKHRCTQVSRLMLLASH